MKHILLLALVISGLLAGCGQNYVDGTSIPFTRLVDFSAWEGSFDGKYLDPQPMMIIASATREYQHLIETTHPDVRSTVVNRDPTREIIIAVFHGERGGGGFGISIQKIIVQEHQLYIYAQFTTPQRGKFQEGGIRSPFSIVSIERTALPANVPLTVHLMDDATKKEVLVQEYTIK